MSRRAWGIIAIVAGWWLALGGLVGVGRLLDSVAPWPMVVGAAVVPATGIALAFWGHHLRLPGSPGSPSKNGRIEAEPRNN